LIYYRTDSTQEALGNIPLDEVYAVHPSDFKDKEHTFQISTEQRIFYLQAETEDQLHYWTVGISSYIKRTGTQDKIVLKQIEEREKAEEERKEKESQRMSGEEKDKKLKIKSPKSRRSKEIDVATKSESFLTKTIGVPKKLQYYSRSGRSSSEIGREKKMKQSLPSPRKKAELELEITKPDSSGDDASPSDSDSDSEEIIESPKPIIGKNVVNAAIPNRKPPAPPKDEAPDNPIRVAGVVSPSMPKNSEASQNTPKGWITRTDIPDTGEQTQFVHSNTIFNQIDDASACIWDHFKFIFINSCFFIHRS